GVGDGEVGDVEGSQCLPRAGRVRGGVIDAVTVGSEDVGAGVVKGAGSVRVGGGCLGPVVQGFVAKTIGLHRAGTVRIGEGQGQGCTGQVAADGAGVEPDQCLTAADVDPVAEVQAAIAVGDGGAGVA